MTTRFYCQRSQPHLVAVRVGLEGTLGLNAQVLGLGLGENGELGAEAVKVEAGDLLVEVLGEEVDVLAVLLGGALLPELELGEDLVGERARHDERGVAGGAAEVEETALSEDDDGMAVGEDEAVNLGLDVLANNVYLKRKKKNRRNEQEEKK